MSQAVSVAAPRQLSGPEQASLEGLVSRLLALDRRCNYGYAVLEVLYCVSAASMIACAVELYDPHRSARWVVVFEMVFVIMLTNEVRFYLHGYLYGSHHHPIMATFETWRTLLPATLAAQADLHRTSPWNHQLMGALDALRGDARILYSTQFISGSDAILRRRKALRNSCEKRGHYHASL
jgi:hypothetical protein